MKFRILILLALFSIGLLSCSKNVDDVIAANQKARGGDKISELKSIEISAKLTAMGFSTPYRMLFQLPDKIRYELNLMGMNISTIMNGNKGWMMSDSSIQEFDEANLKAMKEELQNLNIYKSILADYKTQGLKVELVGKEKDTSLKAEVYKIKITMKDSTEYMDYIDVNTYLEYKIAVVKNNKQQMRSGQEILYSDYKLVNGVNIPYKIEIKMNGSVLSTFTFEKVDVNKPIDQELFTPKMPKKAVNSAENLPGDHPPIH